MINTKPKDSNNGLISPEKTKMKQDEFYIDFNEFCQRPLKPTDNDISMKQ